MINPIDREEFIQKLNNAHFNNELLSRQDIKSMMFLLWFYSSNVRELDFIRISLELIQDLEELSK